MDEIFIGEKRYISSKQAAQITGYAKDYIGQLCREGRVPARLVGRSWYVLESAITDHRFGNPAVEARKKEKSPLSISPSLQSTWESPRYEASSGEILPSINRLQRSLGRSNAGGTEDEQDDLKVPQRPLEDSWSEWFKRFDTVTSGEMITSPALEESEKEEGKPEIEEQTEEVNIPIHAIHHALPDAFLAGSFKEHVSDLRERQNQVAPRGKREARGMTKAIQIVGVLLVAIAIVVTGIGTGYFDKYIISSSQGRIVAGITLYNK